MENEKKYGPDSRLISNYPDSNQTTVPKVEEFIKEGISGGYGGVATAGRYAPELKFEQTYPTLAKSFKDFQNKQYELFATKMLDYGIENIALGSTLENPEDIELSVLSIWVRLNDKINRLKNILKRKGQFFVKNESMEDTFKDIANYGIIANMVIQGKWKK